jgi:hypothetical protein
MKSNYWRKVDAFGDCPLLPVLITDGADQEVWIAHTSCDYYDAQYWFPMPHFPMETCITNDEWIRNLDTSEGWNEEKMR